MGFMNDLVMDDLFAAEQNGHHSVMLETATDLSGFKQHARRLLAAQVAPESVSWHSRDQASADLFASSTLTPPLPLEHMQVQVPAGFVELCESVILHSDPGRFGLLYRLLWRLTHEPGLRHDPLDADRIQVQNMAQAVRRDMHKMKAFIRFRTVQDDIFKAYPQGSLLHVAWFEPEHHIVEAIAPFFIRRFTQMRWAILTPECCINWNGANATLSPGASKADAPATDAGEQLWLTYYQSIFNPARLKMKAMQKEMPRKYWKNLPEAGLISGLAASAHERRLSMIDQKPQAPRRRIPIFRAEGEAAVRALAGTAHAPAAEAPDLEALAVLTQQCRDCPIGQHATQAVCGEGPAQARVLVVGEQPGDQEDLHGRPFVGPAGQLFDRALADLGQDRKSLYITNAVKHFKYEPRGKRRLHKTPSQQEASVCSQWLEREITLVKPELALALGATAASSLLGRRVAVMSERGQWFTRSDGLRVLVTLHPSALLRMEPHLKEAAYAEWLQDVRTALDGENKTLSN